MYGIQTTLLTEHTFRPFENDVKMYGIQTISFLHVTGFMFENDVKMYGIQTNTWTVAPMTSLRMM